MRQVIMPLANDVNDEWTAVGLNFQARADTAVMLGRYFQAEGDEVYFMQAAGTLAAQQSHPTLGALGAAYIDAQWPDAPLLVNISDKYVWGTYPELRWAIARINDEFGDTPVRLLVVTQPRHIFRVRCMLRFLTTPPSVTIEVVPSWQTKELSWIGEWGSLLIFYAGRAGFERPLRWLRRRIKLPRDRGTS